MRSQLKALAAAALIAGCASRSTLHSVKADATMDDVDASMDTDLPDTAVETWSQEVGAGPVCGSQPADCPPDDFGPRFAIGRVYDACVAEVAKECGDLFLAFDDAGCLVEVREIRHFSPAFIACVVAQVSPRKWRCAPGKTLRMFEACP